MNENEQKPFGEAVEIEGSSPDGPNASKADEEVVEFDGPEDELHQALKERDAAQQELAKHRDAMLRMQAESENTRKRLTRDAEKSRRFALERILKDLLQVVDTMERGLETDIEHATVESLLEGQALTLKMLKKVLADHQLELVDPAGEAFDPELHEAVTLLPSAEHEEGTVMEVLQKGYKLHDRLIRPAMVVVSGKP